LTTNEDSNDVSIVDLESGAVTSITVGNTHEDCRANGSGKAGVFSRRITISGFTFAPALKVAQAKR
jgi:hypothetical protein